MTVEFSGSQFHSSELQKSSFSFQRLFMDWASSMSWHSGVLKGRRSFHSIVWLHRDKSW